MINVGISIIVVAVALFILSYFTEDKLDDIESKIEQLSVTTTQDTFQMKKKIETLEDEVFSDDVDEVIESSDKPQ